MGANALRRGYALRAADGALFLHEVGELPLPVQALPVGLVQEGVFLRVGSEKSLPFASLQVRANNAELAQRIREAGHIGVTTYHLKKKFL
ncbi:sigma 54-interacting transcriptional regulator [Azospirillum sp. RWY-5-1]|uniref:Sigma 54-interacting transcriptional regulator n=1 Tax=Azospirillum oleiclasticum TaxID=2735135 RepID=A0ABX2TBH8_9PROT|nr:sigma 54-interacting transcriptional regulator [Azospirillum oleiclasticum]NYZ20528.1 sigma 54-interacting transcriptional regulator [Azospirillum oleiclasticum]